MAEQLAKNIRAQRLAQNMTQEQLAAKLFTTRQCISNYETGKSKPDEETVGRIAAALGISVEALLDDAAARRKKVRAWCTPAAALVLCGLAWALYSSPLLINSDSMAAYLTYAQGYTTMIVPAGCFAFGWGVIRLYERYARKGPLHTKHAKWCLLALAVILGAWFLAAWVKLPQMYRAVSVTLRHQYEPTALSVYQAAFYYKSVYRTLLQLPALNGVFILAGGWAAVCKNGTPV